MKKVNYILNSTQVKLQYFVVALFVLLSINASKLFAQTICPLVGNDLVHLSVASGCEATVTPSLVLESTVNAAVCEYFIVLYDTDGNELGGAGNGRTTYVGGVEEHPTVGFDQLGDTIVVGIFLDEIIDMQVDIETENNTWSRVLVEDKLPTQITCPEAFEVPCTDTLTHYMLLNAETDASYTTAEDFVEVEIIDATNQDITVEVVNDANQFELITALEVCVNANADIDDGDLMVTLSSPDLTLSSSAVAFATDGGNTLCFTTEMLNGTQTHNDFISGDWVVNVSNASGSNVTVTSVALNIESITAFGYPYDTDNCNDTEYEIIEDKNLDYNCRPDNAPYTMTRQITVVGTDTYGNETAPCAFEVSYIKPVIADIVIPRDTIVRCSEDVNGDAKFDNPYDFFPTDDDGNFLATEDGLGVPTLNGQPLYPSDLNHPCKLNVTYSDKLFDGCGIEFKLLRTWIIYDWCRAESYEYTQVMKSIDDLAPVVTSGVYVVSDAIETAVNSCTADFTLDFFRTLLENEAGESVETLDAFVYDCSDIIIEQVGYKEANPDGSEPGDDVEYIFDDGKVIDRGDGVFDFKGLSGPRVWVRFFLTDECGNNTNYDADGNGIRSSIAVEVDINDNIPPQVICDEYTAVTLNDNGWARVEALSFDDGSYDYCSDVTYQVRRMTSPCNHLDEHNDLVFGDFVQFCCEDVGVGNIQVALQVSDASGNKSTCMVQIEVQEKRKPTYICADYDPTVACDLYELDGLPSHPPVINTDKYCGTAEPNYTDVIDLDDCGVGTVTRSWYIQLGTGEKLSTDCIQVFDIYHTPDLSDCYDSDSNLCNIIWPADIVSSPVIGCMEEVATPEALDEVPSYGDQFPKYKPTGVVIDEAPGCAKLGYTYSDQVFSDVDDACFKILRTWTVVDWCLFSNDDPYAGVYTNTQVIKMDNDEEPVFTLCGTEETEFCAPANSCTVNLTLNANANDGCSGLPIEQSSSYQYRLYQVDGGQDVLVTGGARTGKSFTRNLEIGKYKVVWTVIGSCDQEGSCTKFFEVKDCTPPAPYCKGGITTAIFGGEDKVEVWASDLDLNSSDLCGNVRFSFSPDVTDRNKVFTCDDIGENPVRIYVTDEAGNQDYCDTKVIIQANNGSCGTEADRVMLAGQVTTEYNNAVANVDVAVESMVSHEMSYQSTVEDGQFAFYDMLSLDTYKMTATKEDNYRNGVSTLDIIKIQRHILNIEEFDSPYKLIAADVNNNQSISAADIVVIRKLILEQIDAFPDVNSWRLVDKNIELSSVDNPWAFEEDQMFFNQAEDVHNANWIAVKSGDVNGSALINDSQSDQIEPRSSEVLLLQTVKTDNGFDIVAADNAALAGLQIQLSVSAEAIHSEMFAVSEANAVITQDYVRLSCNDNEVKSIAKGDVLFTIMTTDNNQAVYINGEFSSEAYGTDFDVQPIFLDQAVGENAFVLYQNAPNPFKQSTTIAFSLPKAGVATMDVMDINGRTIYSISDYYAKGKQSLEVFPSGIMEAGVLYYRLTFDGKTATKKMILLD